MNFSKRMNLIFIACLSVIEVAFFILILFFGNLPNMHVVSYISIVVCFLFSLFFVFQSHKYLIPIGLFFTLLADLFLILLGDEELRVYGMLFFMMVQFIYGFYLLKHDLKHKTPTLIIRISLTVVLLGIGIFVLKEKTDFLSVFSLIYLANLVSNIIACCFNLKRYYLFFIALLLFFMCDIYTGLVIADGTYLHYVENGFFYHLVNLDFNITWLFYIPSQTLIAIYTNALQSQN